MSLEKGIGAHQYIALKEDDISLRVSEDKQVYIQSFLSGQWLEYQVNVQSQNSLQIAYATYVNSQVCIYVDGVAKAVVELPKTGGLDIISTLSTNMILPTGNHTIRIEVLSGTFNFYQIKQ
jgi:hypothetical protein